MILLTPGPCQTSETVRHAGTARDINHREPQFIETMTAVKQGLLRVYPGIEHWTAFLLAGSGTACMEAMAASCVAKGPVLVLVNGYYSSRLAEILEVHHVPCERLVFDWLNPISLVAVEDRLREKAYEAVFVTHHETTTGRLNPVEVIGKIAHAHGARCMVDAMSSFGADPLDFEHVDAVCASSNKCLHGVPGVAFVLARPDLVAGMRGNPRRTYYLHLPHYEGDSIPSTPPVPALVALQQALEELGPEGALVRHRIYAQRAERIRSALRARGLLFLVDPAKASCSLTTCQIPSGYTIDEWMAANRAHGYQLYRCKGGLAEGYFQVANMGELADEEIDGWIALLDVLAPNVNSG